MAAFDDEYFGDFPEVECEFCGVSFPLELINEHEVMVHSLEIDQFHGNFEPQENLLVSTNTTTQSKPIVEPKTNVQTANVIDKPKQVSESYQTKGYSENEQQGQPSEQKQPVINLGLEREQFNKYVEKLDINNDKGERLLAYGPGMNPEKGMDDEKEIYKMPENLLQDKKEKKNDVIDINDLSDDECSESLEEFWKRAQDALKYQRNKQKSELMMSS